MKKTVTLFTLLLLALTIQTAAAQQCPTIEKLTAKAADQQALPAHLLESKAGEYYVVFNSDLSDQQQFSCLATRGRHTILSTLSADDPLASFLEESWVEGAWVNEYETLLFYNNDVESQVFINEWDATTESWVAYDRSTAISRDANGFVTEWIGEAWNGTSWDPEFRALSEWDAAGNQTRLEGQEWDGSAWNSVFLSETVITSESIITVDQFEDADGMLAIVFRETIELDDQGRETTKLDEFWDADMSVWVPSTRSTKEYQGMTITEKGQVSDGMDGWLDIDETVYTLNSAGLPVEAITSSLILGTPMPSDRVVSTYNDMNLLIEERDQKPDGAGGWVDDLAYFATFDSDGDILQELYQAEDGTGKSSALENQSRDTYTYGPTATSIDEELGSTFAAFDIYPSPARDRVQVEVTLEQPGALAVDVYDVLGRRVHQMADEQAAAGTQQFAWEPGDMPAGMYFIRITLDERAETRPLMLMK